MTDSGRSAGALLKAAREKQGLHIAALAAAIKVAPRKLDALENDRWDELPDATFIRALAQTVCRSLKIDAKPVLDLLPAAGATALDPGDSQLNTPFRERPGRVEPGMSVAAVRPMIWAAALFMIAAVAVYFMPVDLFGSSSKPAESTVAVPVPEPAVAPAAPASVAAAPATAAASAAPLALAASEPAASPPTLVVPSAPLLTAAPPAVAAPASAAVVGIVQLRTTGASWVEARDGRGQVLLSRLLQAGERVGLDGNLPIRLTVGNAAVTEVGFRGQTIDLSTRTSNNVARVELQ